MIALVVAAHPDDEVLGCGGTIARLAKEGHEVHVLLMTDGEGARFADNNPADELVAARRLAAEQAGSMLGIRSLTTHSLPDNRLDSIDRLDVVRVIEAAIERLGPFTVLTHHSGDTNIDHRVVHDAAIVACRPQPGNSVKALHFFEIPSSSEWRPATSAPPFVPNLYIDISETLDAKLAALEVYSRELRSFPHPRSKRGVEALARWRGVTAGVSAAEAFIIGREIR